MERIERVLQQWKERLPIQGDKEQLLQRIFSAPPVQAFRSKHPDIPREVYLHSLVPLRQYVKEQANCGRCPGLEHCPNMVQGHQPELVPYSGLLELRMQPCDKLKRQEEQKRRSSLIRSHYIPKDILSATFNSLILNQGRIPAIDAAAEFCEQFAEGRPRKGLYFYGDFGVGKSHIAGAIAQRLVDHGVDSLMVYVPDFIREVKDSIRDGQVQEKLDALKKATVLILDDIGAENLTPWARDEVLGTILQYRVTQGLPTLYTSNLNLDELEKHLAYSEKGGVERTKAKRIMERIRHHVQVFHVKGPNRRGM
ncbi:primosomal protein DnaI [Marinithermofilum abyssi]|uniref:Primosomal protein DnaI n=1 Tax=Marinithermofilum abyssi TaxID=1571185 RepID=A0A8J2VIP2_9BACL|nr:primosomal protein DnaI [Marinithermofilum abyssi]GGE17587.1 primosomal protein DnaI [Marinithermofilum abyssi]